MNKTDLIAEVAKKNELTKAQAEAVVNTVIDSISDALASDDKVQLFGFGSFEVKTIKARTGINPRTKEQIEIPASKRIVFSAGKKLKDSVNK